MYLSLDVNYLSDILFNFLHLNGPMDDVSFSSPSTVVTTKEICLTRNTIQNDVLLSRVPLSSFERITATHPPVLESLLLQLPTLSILSLYHTSRFLRSFLQSYPIAWNFLSFRLLNSGRSETRQPSPASDVSGDIPFRRSRQYALDQLLNEIIVPFGTRLKSLDLDHTSASGLTLTSTVLPARRETLQHLSVRGCKNVSLKYHVVPYLTLFSLQKNVRIINNTGHVDHLALKSLYTFRCRHHRRRPYLPASLIRRESDAEPTHELIKICYVLGIWTDTAWCPTPGGRCLRRKDYYTGRGTLDGRGEVWVVFDRLWRSGNRLGRSMDNDADSARYRGQLWEDAEIGYEGEPLGASYIHGEGEGKMVPAHLRRSHTTFVEGFKCHECGNQILERCEQCSVRMHCVGCRKILCANCAFSRPLPRSKLDTQVGSSLSTTAGQKENPDSFWWAPGETRSPNLMMQESSSNEGIALEQPNSSVTPAIKMHWCCLKPMFSGGGGITFVGPGMSGACASQIRTAPLPRGQGWEDVEFTRIRQDKDFPMAAYGRPDAPDYNLREGHDRMLRWLLYGPGNQDSIMCSRSLCQECWQLPGWRAQCQACHEPFCFAHDLRGLKMRICGYRDLSIEKRLMKEKCPELAKALSRKDSEDELLECIKDLLGLADTQNPQYTHELAARTELPNSNDDDLTTVPDDIAGTNKIVECISLGSDGSQSMPHSVSGSSLSTAPPNPLESKLPPLWWGCASFMCPEYRSIGDHRPKCTAVANECSVCGVHVCPACLLKNPACDCSACLDRYRCPNCFRNESSGFCKKAEEDEQWRMAELEEELRKEGERKLEELADERVKEMRDFFAMVENGEILTLEEATDVS